MRGICTFLTLCLASGTHCGRIGGLPQCLSSARLPLASKLARGRQGLCGVMRLKGGSDMEDAERYLGTFGIVDLDPLTVSYVSETGTVYVEAGGDSADFDTSDRWLARQPEVQWNKKLGNCTLLMLDPDAPDRASAEGDKAGLMGPWLHWLVTDAVERPEDGTCVVEHMGPAPPKGKHRYIFVLFKQKGGAKVHVPSLERKKWDFGGFLKSNPGLEPVSYQMYHVTSGSHLDQQ